MKIFLADGLTCKCKSPRLYLANMNLLPQLPNMTGFNLSIYFECPHCERGWFVRLKEPKKRVFIKQKMIDTAQMWHD